MRMSHPVSENFKKINSLLIGREKKDATYKFALIRGAIEICEKSTQHIIPDNNPEWVKFPLGLMIEQWMIYYYPIYEYEIPQQKREKNNASRTKFRKSYDPVIAHYKGKEGGYSKFVNDLITGNFSPDVEKHIFNLAKAICTKVTEMPMEYLGTSVGEKIFIHERKLPQYKEEIKINRKYLIDNFGTFSIKIEYFHAFTEVGPFVTGDKSILFGWTQMTHELLCTKRSFGDLLKIIATEPVRDRIVDDSRAFYRKLQREEGILKCVWTNEPISHYDEKALDHMIPFSVWKNNELWNILPALKKENQTKSDFIPHPDLLLRQKALIISYWTRMHNDKDCKDLFMEQIRYSLLGNEGDVGNWQDLAFASLHKKCSYLVEILGYQTWSPA